MAKDLDKYTTSKNKKKLNNKHWQICGKTHTLVHFWQGMSIGSGTMQFNNFSKTLTHTI